MCKAGILTLWCTSNRLLQELEFPFGQRYTFLYNSKITKNPTQVLPFLDSKSGLHRVNLTACLGLSPCFCILLHIPNNINLNTRKHASPNEHSQPLKLEQFTKHSKRKSKYEDKKIIFTQGLMHLAEHVI